LFDNNNGYTTDVLQLSHLKAHSTPLSTKPWTYAMGKSLLLSLFTSCYNWSAKQETPGPLWRVSISWLVDRFGEASGCTEA